MIAFRVTRTSFRDRIKQGTTDTWSNRFQIKTSGLSLHKRQNWQHRKLRIPSFSKSLTRDTACEEHWKLKFSISNWNCNVCSLKKDLSTHSYFQISKVRSFKRLFIPLNIKMSLLCGFFPYSSHSKFVKQPWLMPINYRLLFYTIFHCCFRIFRENLTCNSC